MVSPITMHHSVHFLSLFTLLSLITGCEINQKEVLPEDGFTENIQPSRRRSSRFILKAWLELTGGGYIFISSGEG